MNTLIKRYTDVPLILRIVIGMVIGIALALAAPGISWISTLGSLFTTALKAIAPILVFFLVIGKNTQQWINITQSRARN